MRAIAIIRSEHRALAAVLAALEAFLDGVARGDYELDLELVRAMLQYVTELPDRVHHPKEDEYLFALLRLRSPSAAALLDRLEHEHRTLYARWSALNRALATLEEGGAQALPGFRAAVDGYIEQQWQHMSTEEREVLPLASRALLPEDWTAIDRAFAANENPWEGLEGRYKALFARILALAPPPIGVGDAEGAEDQPAA